jgi:hypothetical protein
MSFLKRRDMTRNPTSIKTVPASDVESLDGPAVAAEGRHSLEVL